MPLLPPASGTVVILDGLLLASTPVLIVFLVFRRHTIRGSGSGLKG